MKELNFPLLEKEDIEVRVGGGNTLLLYKTARTDSRILDKIVGKGNWQKKFYTLQGVGMGDKERSIVVCSVGIYDEDKHEWVWKDDSGTESQVEQDKGVCSDAFKRAAGGSSWGIGRELYTAPRIPIPEKFKKTQYFEVSEIGYDKDGNINNLTITTDFGKSVVYCMKNGRKQNVDNVQAPKPSTGETMYENSQPITPKEEEQITKFQDFSSVKGSIDAYDKAVIQAYLETTDKNGQDKFFTYMDTHYNTMSIDNLSEIQGKQLADMLRARKGK